MNDGAKQVQHVTGGLIILFYTENPFCKKSFGFAKITARGTDNGGVLSE